MMWGWVAPCLQVGHEHEVAALAEVAAQRLLEDVAQHGARLGPLVAVLAIGSDGYQSPGQMMSSNEDTREEMWWMTGTSVMLMPLLM